ncbi:hypothetical protein HC931_26900 [Candidatus Gracilibacteria bacterium]|nr:hypothetical protein [Candidatus Gracilibacteria bacterium]NJM90340.1 hypothetical protein [Hydrococcus sp. RU_2_2]NJP22220.1 hypothetical protein [Hydrococcus sp. CRU_1_1]NJQ98947.1 hypothetical protein [Hydrococcus sp. CSU_1_8]
MIIVKSPSVWMIHLNSIQNKPAEWINLAAIEQLLYLENEEIVQIKFASGKIISYRGEQAKMFLVELAKCPGLG